MIELVRQAIDVTGLLAAVPADGAVCLFLGVVRNEHGGRRVLRLEYEAFEEMALSLLREIAEEATRRFPVSRVRVVHRLGRLEVGEASVAVAVSAPHRGEAFEACRFVVDALKATVPIWKREFYEDGAAWLEGPGTSPVGPATTAAGPPRPGDVARSAPAGDNGLVGLPPGGTHPRRRR